MAQNVLVVTENGAKYQISDGGALLPFNGTTIKDVDKIFQVMNRILIADFDAQFNRDLYNSQTIGCWTLNPADITQGSRFSFESMDVKSYGFGSCIKVRYDVECKGEAANGFFIKPQGTHISNCDLLSIWVRGSDHFGFTTRFQIGVKNDSGDKFEFMIEGVTANWQNYLLDLKDVKMLDRWATINEIYTVFDLRTVTRDKGVVYLDHFEYLTISRL